jgi:hypothetical protein
MMMPLPLQSIGHLFFTKDSLRSSTVISAAGKDGFSFKDGSGKGCLAQLIISILSMDYEEG